MIVLIDNGGANIASLGFALTRLGARFSRSADPQVIAGATRLILPGVGAAGEGMRRLQAQGIDVLLRENRRPLLGICLGMQLLFEQSEENATPALGLLPGRVTRLKANCVRVPHMGWNSLAVKADHPVLAGITGRDWFYFVHGYAADITDDCRASSCHGREFAAVAARDNVVATQFHPERSGDAGARVLKNFLDWNP